MSGQSKSERAGLIDWRVLAYKAGDSSSCVGCFLEEVEELGVKVLHQGRSVEDDVANASNAIPETATDTHRHRGVSNNDTM